MENNKDKTALSTGDKLNKGVEAARDTANAVKDGASLAANASTGNVAGVAKDAIKLAKNKQVQKLRKIQIAASATGIILVILLVVAFFGVLNELKNEMVDLLAQAATSVSGFLQKTWKNITDDHWIDLGEEFDYVVDADTGQILGTADEEPSDGWKDASGKPINTETETYTMVDEYVKQLGEKGFSLKDLGILGEADYSGNILEDEENKALVEKYIAEFIRADIITSQPHRRRGTALVSDSNQNLIDGGVYIYRSKKEPTIDDSEFVNGSYDSQGEIVDEKEYKQMEFMEYDDFIKKVGGESQETTYEVDKGVANDLRYSYTVDPNTGELLFVEIKTTEIAESKVEVGDWFLGGVTGDLLQWLQENLGDDVKYEVKIIRADYKGLISKYSMPYEFLLNLCAVTGNPEFVYHVALLARETNIMLVIHDNTTMEVETVETEEDKQDYRNDSNNSTSEASISNKRTEKTRKITKTTTQTPVLNILEADTWSFYTQCTYTKDVTGTKTDTDIIVGSGNVRDTLTYHEYQSSYTDTNYAGEKIEIKGEKVTYWADTFTTETRTRTQLVTTTTTYNDPIEKSVEKSKQFLGLLRNSTGECPENCYEETAWRRQVPLAATCAKEAEFDRQGKDVEYRLPTSTEMEAPIDKLLSGLDILYSVLQSNSTGYDEEKLAPEDKVDEAQEQYTADKDYESAYVVEMQGLVEHLRYLMTFPDEPTYTKLDLILEYLDDVIDDFKDAITGEKEPNTMNGYIVKTDDPGAAPIISDKEQLREAIEAWLAPHTEMKENALSVLDTVYECQEKYQVNTLFIYAVMRNESGIGTAVSGNDWVGYISNDDFASVEDGIERLANNIKENYFTDSRIAVYPIGEKYCTDPPPPEWGNRINNYMTDIYEIMNISIPETSAGNYIEYKQGDYKSEDVLYNATGTWGTIAEKGCLPTSIAIIASGYGKTSSTGEIYTPETIITDGILPEISNHTNAKKALEKLGLNLGEQTYTSDSNAEETILSHLESGNPVLVHCSEGYYTSGGHYMTLIGVRGRKVYLSNPGSRSKTGYVDISTLISRNVDWFAVVNP